MRGYWSEGRAWLEGMLAQVGGGANSPSAARAKALQGIGVIAWTQGDYAVAGAAAEESVSLYRALGDKADLADSLANLAIVMALQGDQTGGRTVAEEMAPLTGSIV